MELERRRLLHLTGVTATATTVGMAGCLDSISGSDDDDMTEEDENGTESDDEPTDDEATTETNADLERASPVYKPWLTTDGERLQFASVATSAFEHRDLYEDERAADELDGEADDQLLTVPLIGAYVTRGRLGFAQFNGGSIGRIVDELDNSEDFAYDDLETTIDRVFSVEETLVCFGDIVPDEIEAELTESVPNYETEFEAADESDAFDAFDIYRPVESDPDSDLDPNPEQAFGVGANAIVFTIEDDDSEETAIETVSRLIAARIGVADRAIDRVDELEWHLETAGEADVLFADYSPADRANDDLYGVISGLTYEGTTSASSDLIMTFERQPDLSEDGYRQNFGYTADERSLDLTEARLLVSGTWDDVDAVLESGT